MPEPFDVFIRSWAGTGELRPRDRVGLLGDVEAFEFERQPRQIDAHRWDLVERFRFFTSGELVEQRLQAELISTSRLRITAPDLERSTTVTLRAGGFDCAPYTVRVRRGRWSVRLRVHETGRLREDGDLLETIDLRWRRLQVAEMTIHARAGGS